MLLKNLKIIFSIFIFSAFILSPALVFAQKLEIQYPSIPFSSIETPNEFMSKIEANIYPQEHALPLYINYFYYLALMIAGIVAFGAIVFGGFQYLISSGSPIKIIIAKEQILGGFMSLIILFSSYIILTNIDPGLTVFDINALKKIKADSPEIEKLEFDLPVYFEIPTGMIIENAVLDEQVMQKMNNAKQSAKQVSQASQELKILTDQLKQEVDNCDCGTTSGCSLKTGCVGTSCSGAQCNKEKIKEISKKVKEAIDILKEKEKEVKAASLPLIEDSASLQAVFYLMSSEEVFAYNDLLSIKEYYTEVETETFPGWENMDLKINGKTIKDPLTFYLEKKGNEKSIYFASAELWGHESFLPPEPPGGWPAPPLPEPGKISFPLSEEIIKKYGCSDDYMLYRPGSKIIYHRGVDLIAPLYTPIFAVQDGVVVRAGFDASYGWWVAINHTSLNLQTRYAHLLRGSLKVSKGDQVTAGQIIGMVDDSGSSYGNHLHFEVLNFSFKDNQLLGLLDPKNYFPSVPQIICSRTPN